MNEPEFSDRYRWIGVQMKVATAIREGAPRHTIIALGHDGRTTTSYFSRTAARSQYHLQLHFYEPHIFTHQGATWGDYYWHWLKGRVIHRRRNRRSR
jgi:hypothetical protein